MRELNVSPDSSSSGRRLACATAAAVTMFIAPGPTDEVAAMNCRRRMALAKPMAARAMPCSFCPRYVGQHAARVVQRLAETRHVAVAEDAEDACQERALLPVDNRPLGGQEAHDRLRRREPLGLHRLPPTTPAADVMGRRGSSSMPSQVARIQCCGGSSVNASLRGPASDAITLR